MAALHELVVVSNKDAVTLVLKEGSLSVTLKTKGKRHEIDVPYRQVISAKTQVVRESHFLEIFYLVKPTKKRPFVLRKIDGRVEVKYDSTAVEWVDSLMLAAYKGRELPLHVKEKHTTHIVQYLDTKNGRRLKVLVNPYGGRGHAIACFTKVVEPIFRAAGCLIDVTFTTHRGHAFEIAKDLPLDHDVIVTLSGDGLIHEVLNGFAQHTSSLKAFDIPLAPIPTGSANGLCLNLLGLDDGFDVAAAALNVIKGQPMKSDIFTVTQNGKQTMSFMSQALGLMADVDFKTEHLRWMGDTRFVYGFLRGLIAFKPCPVQLSIKVAEQDKNAMAEALNTQQTQNMKERSVGPEDNTDSIRHTPRYPVSEDGWITIDEPILFLFAGQGPYVSRDLMVFPVSLPDDGVIDVVVQELSSRREMLAAMNGAEKGEPYWLKSQRYFKAHAYRVKPLSTKGCLAIDGEEFPFDEYEVGIRPGLATLLSPYGRYAAQLAAVRKDSVNS